MSINLLNQNTINQIAAGEVVDRPSSVVKELVENAIDAGATAITVEIKDGGISFIRITDNGCGIEKSDVKTAFLRHATSKIKDAADLVSISSLGFRGEALSSISAVAQVELITKTKNDLSGIRYEINGGVEKNYEEVGAPSGTTFIVRNLFYNTPARRKFLKTPATEGSYINSLMEHLCMSHPDISFRYIQNNQTKLQTSGNGNLKDIIYNIYGREIAKELLEVNGSFENFTITGYIAKPVVSRSNRNFENYYINGRYIKSPLIMKAIEAAYEPYMMQHKYPFTAFHIDIEPNELDVNVHPSKMELRFANGPYLHDSIINCITEALKRRELVPEIKIETLHESPIVSPPKPPTEPKITTETVKSPVITRPAEPFETIRMSKEQPLESVSKPVQMVLFDEPDLLQKQNLKDIKIIGQVFDTYWIVQFENSMYIIDQHAAHEKVLYEEFINRYSNRLVTTQLLNPPVIIELTGKEEEVLKENMNYFTEYGFELEDFGDNSYAIRGIPADFTNANTKELMLEILDSMSDDSFKKTPDSIKDKIATMACKAAVKGNNRISYKEAQELINKLMDLDNPYNCPHGRPTMITMTQNELEKKFKRII